MNSASQSLRATRAMVAAKGEPVAIGRYAVIGAGRARTDVLSTGFVRNFGSSELTGLIVQGDQKAIVLVDTLAAVLPVTANDWLIVGFEVINGVATMVNGRVVGGKEYAIKNPAKRVVGGVLIALEIHAKG